MVEEVFETRTEKVNHQYVVKTFLPEIVYIGNTGCNSLADFEQGLKNWLNIRHPTRILYVRYSSRSWGASLLRGSYYLVSKRNRFPTISLNLRI